jgi:hypothetical protein
LFIHCPRNLTFSEVSGLPKKHLDTHPDYFGASLSAFVKPGRAKRYRLIGCNQYGFIVFFVRSDIGEDVFPEILPAQCLRHPHAIDGNKNRLPHVIIYEWT